jgi:acetylserotonin N-methyltransferase
MPPQDELKNPDADAQLVIDLMDGFRTSKAVFTAVSLGVFDRLHQGPATCETLAREFHCHPGAFERLLGACAGLGVLAIEQGLYHNLPVATRFLRVASSESLSGYILYSERVLYRLWSHLADAVREGTHRWEQEFGKKESLFDHFLSTEQEKRTFLAAMHCMGLMSSPVTVAAFDLSSFDRLVDLGGGTGHLVIEACKRYPNLRGAVFDLPSVAAVSAEYVAQAGLQDRIEILQGDFFRDEFPPADLYSLGRILHDWSDGKVAELLRRIHGSLPAKGGLLICEKLLNEERNGPATAYLQSLNMLVVTEGRERSASEYEALTKAAGFRGFRFHRTGQPVDVMLAEK